ncbi:exocyst subunit SEC8 [Lachancea thermotolerans CBS 6340]|uniref:Exocyst complex component Sec8 n=1 Tax=Lachancea thermotolerans (strain ATCC 56472 / CBS 6340 / NRRL Y-8284) TaxID=559295 RepID=C5DIT5_LACTC|nr:KLTH0E15048p [Lachancea thermotolerans CBS 6340]CAR23696.1 KLTH0E15048p [Lachancea thermotolerans CBS 6340]
MDRLKPLPQRRRALSVNNATHSEKVAMNSALDSLQSDLNLISSEWNRVITANANPLELALAFLDDTSVGLGHRYNEFKHLNSRLANDLQHAVNEHYQAFNTNIASYEQTVEFINESQEHIRAIKEDMTASTSALAGTRVQLEELNESSQQSNRILEVLNAIERLLALPDEIEDYVRNKFYSGAKEALLRGSSLAATYNLWKIPTLQTTRQILQSQKHTLFETLVEDISDLIYSKKVSPSKRYQIKLSQAGDNDYSNLESHLFNAADLDIEEQSTTIKSDLEKFLDTLSNQVNFVADHSFALNIKENTYERLFSLLQILNDMGQLHAALDGISSRTKEEMHNIIANATEEMRVKHGSLIKLSTPLESDSDFGLTGEEALSVYLRDFFWKVFLKLLLALQCHRAIYEIARALQPSVMAERYRFGEIWHKTLDEIQMFMTNYTRENKLRVSSLNNVLRGTEINKTYKSKRPLTFSLQNNVDDASSTRDHANNLRDLFKEMFPGFSASTSMKLKSIYLEEETFEQEETLIPPKVFNMAFIFESLLLFVDGCAEIVPLDLAKACVSAVTFFNQFMSQNFLPQLEHSLAHLFEVNVESTNTYLLELQAEGPPIFKAAINFKDLFFKILCILNTSHTYRPKLVAVVLKVLDRFYEYYEGTFARLLGTSSTSRSGKKIINVWLDNESLKTATGKFINGDSTCLGTEISLLLNTCPVFTKQEANFSKQEFFNALTSDTVSSFLNTIIWINNWLPELGKQTTVLEEDNPEAVSTKKLKNEWSSFDFANFENLASADSFKILLNTESCKQFDSVVRSFKIMETELVSCLRYDVRARAIYYVAQLFRESSWCPEMASVELDHNISSLTTEITLLESRMRELIPCNYKNLIFEGLSDMLSETFIAGSRTIVALNHNGVRKLLKNISILQHTCRNIASSPGNVEMSAAREYFNLCASNEHDVIAKYNAGELQRFTLDDIKNILRLQLSEELRRQMKRSSGVGRVTSVSANKRFSDAVNRLQIKRHNE